MFPLSDTTGLATASMCKPYLVAMVAMPWAASGLGLASWMLPIGASVPTALWWRSLQAFEQNPTSGTCRKFFLGSLSYLLATLALFTASARVEAEDGTVCNDFKRKESPQQPAWRIRFGERFAELCPHEKVKLFCLGVLDGSCPFSGGAAERKS